jgi:hypothetical protein
MFIYSILENSIDDAAYDVSTYPFIKLFKYEKKLCFFA